MIRKSRGRRYYKLLSRLYISDAYFYIRKRVVYLSLGGCDRGFLIVRARRRPLVTRTRGILDGRQGIPRPTDAERARRPRDHVTITHTARRRRNASLPRAQ